MGPRIIESWLGKGDVFQIGTTVFPAWGARIASTFYWVISVISGLKEYPFLRVGKQRVWPEYFQSERIIISCFVNRTIMEKKLIVM